MTGTEALQSTELTAAERRAALRRLVVIFGLMNKMIELSATGAPRQLAEHAAAARDLVGELVTDMAQLP
ncbi:MULTISPECIES: hypothetical protein [Nocardia]|uniref:hypothetical protein n=1 Tax=Nocardia TaxID=1817 RepID=UPI001C4EE9D8|nr:MULTISPECIES: hypothetical protein [Nocardia]